MGPNSKRAQRAAAASRNVSARARFSKPPPNKNKQGGRGGRGGQANEGGRGGGGRGGGRGRGRGRGRGGGREGGRGRGRGGNARGNGSAAASATRSNVIDKLSKRVHEKAKNSSEIIAKQKKHPLAGLDKSQLDEVTLSENLVQVVTKLLTDLNVMDSNVSDVKKRDLEDGNDANAKLTADESSANDNQKNDNDEAQDSSKTASPLFRHLTEKLSFSSQHAQRACDASQNWSLSNKPEHSNDEKNDADEMGLAMDWLCLHLTEEELKQGFKPNKKGGKNGAPRLNTFGSLSSAAHPSISVAKPISSDADWHETVGVQSRILSFIRLGFHQAEAEYACRKTKHARNVRNSENDVAAISLLLSNLETDSFHSDTAVSNNSLTAADLEYADSEREQEVEALSAIYDHQFEIRSVDGVKNLKERYMLMIEPNEQLEPPARTEECKLHVFLRAGYPIFTPPLLLFINSTLPPSLLRRINVAMIEHAHQNLGEQVVFSVVNFLCENLPVMQKEFIEEQRLKEITTIPKHKEVKEIKSPVSDSGRVKTQDVAQDDDEKDFMAKLRASVATSRARADLESDSDEKKGERDRARRCYSLVEPDGKNDNHAHLPTPVAVPTGDLEIIMRDVVKAQTEQPWLVSPEARVPVSKSNSDTLTPEEQHERRRISKNLKDNLKRWYKAAAINGKQEHKMLSQRQKLPAYMMKEEIVKTIGSNQVTVICGDTGCGKTTQVCQLVLDDMIKNNRGSEANIIVTQPRRISAIGVAERIASERCERVGQTTGYSIRLENKRSAKTRLLLCTTGILLRRLQCDPDLASVSHVFVDEVHERDINTDFLLIIVKELLQRRKQLKLVLMSATLNADTFSAYFGGCPTVSIPGRTHPVEENRLEDVLSITGFKIKEGSDYALKKSNQSSRRSKSELAKIYPKYNKEVLSSLAIVDENVINYELVAELVEHIVLNKKEGAILVFMPGLQEITKTIEEIQKKDLLQTIIYPLHSSLSTSEQSAIFQVPPPGVRKVVVSTNIAETSITIEDVVFVIDSGRVKENRQDQVNQMMTLVDCWVSQASAKQRRGRAGRVRPGVSYHLFSSNTNRNEMREYQLPEMSRVGLEDLVLQILLLDLGEPSNFLTKAVDPPSALAIRNSLKLLEGLGAVDCEWGAEDERERMNGNISESESLCANLSVKSGLTALGFHLATLPLDPRVGKMMIYGALFGCTDAALTIAASMSARNPFVAPFDKREEADTARKRFATEGSDHLTTLEAFNQWKDIRKKKGERTAQSFLRENYLSRMTMYQMEDLRKQFAGLLIDIGFLPKNFKMFNRSDRPKGKMKEDYNDIKDLVKAVLCAGLYPNIIVGPKNEKKPVGMCAFNGLKGEVFLHPGTIAFSEKKLSSRYCCYHEIVKTSKTYVRDATPVSEIALLLFGGNLRVYHAEGVVVLDEWLKFRISAKPATLVKHLRDQMEKMLLKKIISPDEDVTGSLGGKALIQAVSTLLQRKVGGIYQDATTAK